MSISINTQSTYVLTKFLDITASIQLPELDMIGAKIEYSVSHPTDTADGGVQPQFLVRKSSSSSMSITDLQERYKYQPPTLTEQEEIDADLISLSESIANSMGESMDSRTTTDKSPQGLRSILIRSGDAESITIDSLKNTFSLTRSVDVNASKKSPSIEDINSHTFQNSIGVQKSDLIKNNKKCKNELSTFQDRDSKKHLQSSSNLGEFGKRFRYSHGVNDTSQLYEERAILLASIEEDSPSMFFVNNYSVDKLPYGPISSVDLSRSLKSFSTSKASIAPDFVDTDSRYSPFAV